VPGGSTESFRFIINWGDGSPPTPLTLAAIQSAGGPGGFLSLGSIFGAHTFADNGVYHVTITVFDDDGGSAQAELDLVINNVAPIITNLIPEDISADSVGNLAGAFADPGADTWTITIVWGDGEPDTVLIINQGGIQSFQSTHQYFGPPNPNDPAAPIPISVTIDDGDGGVVTVATEFQVPGTGLVAAIALPTPAAPSLIGLGQAARVEGAPQIRGADSASNQATSDNAAGGDAGAEENVREIVLRIISPIGELVRDPRTGRVKELLLTEAQLKDLRDFFRIWPDGHYRIDLREGKAERLIIEVYVREGEMVDPADIEELNAPADAAPVEAPPENSARASEIPNAAWENWQPRRQLAAPTSPDAEAKRVDDEPAELDSAALGEVLSASLASELVRERARRVDEATARTTRGWQRRRLRDTARMPQKP
jgi:hypothetical protein